VTEEGCETVSETRSEERAGSHHEGESLPAEGQPRLDARKAAILTAVVREYVEHAEPVGSKRIVDTYNLGVSAATVRNEMAALEEAGYIAQPHTSAGRVPTDLGYRYFVDALDELRPASEAQKLAVRGFLGQADDLEDLLRRTTQVLAQLTRYASLVLAPAIDRSRLKLVELVALSAQTVLMLLIADTGRVIKRIVDLEMPASDIDLERARTVLNEIVSGLRMADVPGAIAGMSEGAPPELRGLVTDLARAVSSDLVRPEADTIFVGGQAALAGESGFDTVELHQLFELLEEQVTLGRVLAESARLDRPLVRIGEENEPIEQLRAASIVATGYGQDAPGSLGVLGPTRMDYPSVLGVVKAVADHLQETLRSLTEPAVDRGDDG
jgi:heat-inducible transcriptional repressor